MASRIKFPKAPEAKVYLAEWRETKFPTQRELADAMNTTIATISRIETGERDWSKGYLEALAHLVGCRVPDLFQHPSKVRSNPQLDELMKIASTLSESQIAGLLALFDRNTASAPHEGLSAEDLPVRKAKAKSA